MSFTNKEARSKSCSSRRGLTHLKIKIDYMGGQIEMKICAFERWDHGGISGKKNEVIWRRFCCFLVMRSQVNIRWPMTFLQNLFFCVFANKNCDTSIAECEKWENLRSCKSEKVTNPQNRILFAKFPDFFSLLCGLGSIREWNYDSIDTYSQ